MGKFSLRVVIAVGLLCAPASAQNRTARQQLAACNTLTDRTAELFRAGEVERARQAKPQLERCLKLQRAERDRAVRDLVKRHNDLIRQPPGQSI